MNHDISEREILAMTREIIQCPSVNPPADTRQCARAILKRLKENQIPAEIMEGDGGVANVVARLSGQKKGKVLLLNGHMDVVAPGEGWTVDPFGGEVKEGRIYGRGTCDIKSGLASMMAAMIGLKRSSRSFGARSSSRRSAMRRRAVNSGPDISWKTMLVSMPTSPSSRSRRILPSSWETGACGGSTSP